MYPWGENDRSAEQGPRVHSGGVCFSTLRSRRCRHVKPEVEEGYRGVEVTRRTESEDEFGRASPAHSILMPPLPSNRCSLSGGNVRKTTAPTEGGAVPATIARND